MTVHAPTPSATVTMAAFAPITSPKATPSTPRADAVTTVASSSASAPLRLSQTGILAVAVADWPDLWVLWLMAVDSRTSRARSEFAEFVREVEPPLLQALVSTYGPRDGREATVDALSWAWEHRDRLAQIDNKLGYLYRVGQSAVRRYSQRVMPLPALASEHAPMVDVDPGLLPALSRLSEQQRIVVVLVHGFGWSQSEVAKLLDIAASTVREHLSRALRHLRDELVVCDAR